MNEHCVIENDINGVRQVLTLVEAQIILVENRNWKKVDPTSMEQGRIRELDKE